MDRDDDGGGGGDAVVPLSSDEMDFRSVCDFSVVSVCLRWLCCELYTAPYTKVSWVDLAKAVASGTAA
jgi:hypothetical protein